MTSPVNHLTYCSAVNGAIVEAFDWLLIEHGTMEDFISHVKRSPEIINEIYPYFKNCRSNLNANISEFPPHDDSLINVKDCANCDENLGNIVNIMVSYDMGWSKRGNGRSYDSLNGYGAIIGFLSEQILDFSTHNRKCKKCDMGHSSIEHDCRKNFKGSAKAMEADAHAELVNRSNILKEAGLSVRVLIGDEDSSTIASVRSESSQHAESSSIDIDVSLVETTSQNLEKSPNDYKIVYFNLETSGFSETADVLQIAVKCGEQNFSVYVNPTQSIAEGASKVTGLNNINGELFLHDEITNTDEEKMDSKAKALEELNELGETLLKQSLSGTVSTTRLSQSKTNNSVTKIQSIYDPIRKQNLSYDSNNVSQHITTEQSNTKKCERNSNLDILVSSNSSKMNMTVDLCKKNCNSEIMDAKIQQQEMTQLCNGMSRIANTEPEIKSLTDLSLSALKTLNQRLPGDFVEFHPSHRRRNNHEKRTTRAEKAPLRKQYTGRILVRVPFRTLRAIKLPSFLTDSGASQLRREYRGWPLYALDRARDPAVGIEPGRPKDEICRQEQLLTRMSPVGPAT
ncbi:PREDICTED: uncharacterized protein LOC105456595 [Wasmannia auropunctata]|uniref:uncharacterized protein LOC105456595 n=1 Tax=Wasmannia auropunctata TaxID=64793 RepID=UPI0005EF65AD|nr:PREDICTED: uncharacterized protein LOC105456595 [Wasmannia auropunctata]